ncbi:DUF2431 domain-containing protein [Psychrosphaera ytuae]|uniref:DUF2431 domain-containing protein n=1 Tax=Psychrosphaera ytuae TaxID=2820710 RepID=A0A975HI77_9GAMM|nr:Rossmann-like fold-containing protein [Psychrosphaera ytuae]QTH63912.1 DUF2431 domain-containing protein [Psychrosphaera ytuae]
MYLPKHARVVTIGDGDLSFSRALLAHIPAEQLLATTYDDEHVLRDKYAINALDDLKKAGVATLHGIDITSGNSLAELQAFEADIVIFNHPLVPTQKSYSQYQKERDKSANLMNRNLLYHFLKHSFETILSISGLRLCYITTKSVKPYSHWHIETSLCHQQPFRYLGQEPFEVSLFKNYLVRNVDRDKCVKHEASDIYVYSDQADHSIQPRLTKFKYTADNHCPLCRKGPFENESDWALHCNTRIHKAQQQYSDAWFRHLSSL